MPTCLRTLSAIALAAATFTSVCLAADNDRTSLAPMRANQPITMNAMLGFINAEPVFVSDLLRPLDERMRDLAKSARNVTEFREAVRPIIESQLQTTVAEILIMTNARSSLSEEDKGKLDIFINMEKSKIISKHGGSEALANQALKAENSSVDKALKDPGRTVTVELYLNKTLYPKIVLTRQMVLDEYQKNPAKWQQTAEVELYTITLPVSRYLPREPGANGQLGPTIKNPTPQQMKDAQAAALAAGKEVVERLKKGENFAQLAFDYKSADPAASKGGLSPHVTKGALQSQKIENYAFSLPADTVGGEPQLVENADPMLTSVVVIKVGDKKEARTIPFSEAQMPIERELRERQYRQLYVEDLQALYKSAAIERVDRMIDVAVDVAVARYATQ